MNSLNIIVGDISNILSFHEIAFVGLQEDPIFFKKSQLTIGTKLTYYGRTDPGSIWEVTKIHHNYFDFFGQLRHRNVNTPEYLIDLVFLKRISATPRAYKSGKWMSPRLELNFGYLSYSAIWRISK